MAVFHHDHVLDSHAPPARQVDAWLDGEDRSVLQQVFGFRSDPGMLMDREPYAVAQAVSNTSMQVSELFVVEPSVY